MVGNVWFDRETKELSYNIEDAETALLPTREESAEGEQVGPASRNKPFIVCRPRTDSGHFPPPAAAQGIALPEVIK